MRTEVSELKGKTSMRNKIPSPPLSRVLRQGVGSFCDNCGSTRSRRGFLRLFGKRYCDNKKCKNSKLKTNRL